MSTLTREPDQAEEQSEQAEAEAPSGRNLHRGWLLLGVLAVWVLLSVVFQGKQTLAIGGADQIGVQNWLGDRSNDLAQSTGGLVSAITGVTDAVAGVLDGLVQWLQLLVSSPAFPSPYPHIGFLGVLAVAWFFTALVAGWRMSALTAVCFALFALLGFYEDSMDLLVVTFVSVALSVGIGLPLAIWMAHSARVRAVLTPVLDLMQTLPSFVYLIPAIVLFGLKAVPALVATVIFVLPAPIRLTRLGVASTPLALLEAAEAFGATPRQKLWKVELPYALPQIMAGLNQTIMLSLSMVVIAALVGAAGLGTPVVRALGTVNSELGFESGFVIVVVAIVLDRMLRFGHQ